MIKGNYKITKKDFETLKKYFNRDVYLTHELYKGLKTAMLYDSPGGKPLDCYRHPNSFRRTSKYLTFWLGEEYCRQPHHPPFVFLQYLPDIDHNRDFYLLSVQEGITASGKEAVYLKVFDKILTQKYDEARIVCISGARHYTASSQSFSASPVNPDDVLLAYEDIYTGGSGHKRPFYIYILKPNHKGVEVNVHYRSYRGAIDNSVSHVITEDKVYSDYYRGV